MGSLLTQHIEHLKRGSNLDKLANVVTANSGAQNDESVDAELYPKTYFLQ